jgi:aminoglycoside 6-adenylyltransferase
VSDVEGFLADVSRWAREEPAVRAALLVGSQAREDTPADEWSDVDVALFVEDPGRFAGDASWLSAFGEPELTFVEATAVGGELERRVLFADGLEVDFALFPATGVSALVADAEAAAVIERGYQVLHDELGLEQARYHALWTAKKLRRGESLTARGCLECVLKPLLLELAREHAHRRDPAADTWHRSRFVERWADPRVVAAFWRDTADAPDGLPGALRRLCDAFDGLSAEILPPDPGAVAGRSRLEALLAIG